jgi:hypothetical protein
VTLTISANDPIRPSGSAGSNIGSICISELPHPANCTEPIAVTATASYAATRSYTLADEPEGNRTVNVFVRWVEV